MNASNKSEHEKIVRCKSNEKMRNCAYNKRTELEPKSHTQCKSRVGAPGHATVAPSFSTDSSGHPSQLGHPPAADFNCKIRKHPSLRHPINLLFVPRADCRLISSNSIQFTFEWIAALHAEDKFNLYTVDNKGQARR
jgi:hypothetical protein